MNGNDGYRRLAAIASTAGILLVGLFGDPPARAAWETVPSVEVGAYSAKNPRLEPDTQPTADSTSTSAVLNVSANIAKFSERGFVNFEPNLISYRYADAANSDLESDDLFFTGDGEHRWQKASAGFRSEFSRERLLSSELVAVDVDPDNDPNTEDPDAADTGRLELISQNRERLRLTPYVSFRLSERSNLRLDAAKYDVSYSGANQAFRTGFDDTRVTASLHRNVTQRSQVSALIGVENYEADVNQNTFDTVTVEGAFTRPLKQLWTLNFAAGVLRSEFEVVDNQQRVADSATDYTLRLGLRKRGERSGINMNFIRNVFPSASGFSAARRELRVFVDRNFTQRFSGNFGVRLHETESLGDVNVGNDRNYARAEVAFEWALKPVLFLGAGYNYTSQEFTSNPAVGKTDSQAIYIGIGYRGLSKR